MNPSLSFPATLQTPTLAEGHALSQRLAELAATSPAPATMADHLAAGQPASRELLAALYFQAIASANHGWQG